MRAGKYNTSRLRLKSFSNMNYEKKFNPNDDFTVKACDSFQREAIFYMQRIR
jgi:hypothetical protein